MTRRDIRESLSSFNLWGRLDDVDFLSRLYDLDGLPSQDSRFKTAREDIIQHRFANNDWEDDWILYDDRFGLSDGDDETYLRFLAELLHPLVRSDQEEVENLARILNSLLAPDGYRLVVKERVSGRPVFAAKEIAPEPLGQRAAPKHFTEDVRPLIATISRLAELDGSKLEQDVLRFAEPNLEEPEYDNWDGGTYYYTLTLVVPVDVYARLGDQVRPIEERLSNRISAVLRTPDNRHITGVVIQPSLVERTSAELIDVVSAGAQRPVPHFWAPGQFRLFISHVTSFKQRATALRQKLSKYHISGFVAHETIEPGKFWQREIEAALRSMHAMVALVTPDFHESRWTDQEVGWALGSGIHVLPVRRGADPYGFIGEIQGVQGIGKKVSKVADEVFEALLRHSMTRDELLEALAVGFERSSSFQEARDNLALLEREDNIPESLFRRVEVTLRSNDRVGKSSGVAQRVEKMIRKSRGTV
ncbi:MAG: TIR domain-containing protein [bacterium]